MALSAATQIPRFYGYRDAEMTMARAHETRAEDGMPSLLALACAAIVEGWTRQRVTVALVSRIRCDKGCLAHRQAAGRRTRYDDQVQAGIQALALAVCWLEGAPGSATPASTEVNEARMARIRVVQDSLGAFPRPRLFQVEALSGEVAAQVARGQQTPASEAESEVSAALAVPLSSTPSVLPMAWPQLEPTSTMGSNGHHAPARES
jgi:hypothetical protein